MIDAPINLQEQTHNKTILIWKIQINNHQKKKKKQDTMRKWGKITFLEGDLWGTESLEA